MRIPLKLSLMAKEVEPVSSGGLGHNDGGRVAGFSSHKLPDVFGLTLTSNSTRIPALCFLQFLFETLLASCCVEV